MLILGIETSGSVGGVALVENGQLLSNRPLANRGRRHAQTLAAELAILFQEVKRSPAECQGVAISIGPGSFTGLRIGVVCAKTFAYAVGCQLTAVDTLNAIAEESPPDITRLSVMADAQRGDLYVGKYHRQADRWIREGAIAMHPALAWCQNIPKTETVAGPGLDRWEKEFAGEVADAWGLEPYYLRKSSAEEQWELRHPK
jgi:tRNA threonylcarbamoyladenosine biosynthesis protein TsaB